MARAPARHAARRGLLAWLLAGLVTSFSQSSIAALLLGLAVLAAYRWSVRETLYVSLRRRRAGALVVLLAPSQPALRPEGLERLDEQRDERSHAS